MGLTLWQGGESLGREPLKFWLLALGLPFLAWCVLLGLRLLAYLGADSAAEGWDRAREAELSRLMGRGRRSQQILAVSLRTALGAGDEDSGLLNGGSAIRVRSSWQGGSVRHSRLAVDEALPLEEQLGGQLVAMLKDLAPVLAKLPADRPLALLLETSSAIDEQRLAEAWTEAWQLSGIQQTTTRLEGAGLAVIDHWLDRRINDRALLLVVACQFAPALLEDSAEAVVGLLFGNRLTQSTIGPMAYLHRPEAVDKTTAESLSRSLQQALDWVPLAASQIAAVWKVGSDAAGDPLITQAFDKSGLPVSASKELHDLDATLGHAGCATPWLAIAAAVESVRAGGGPQFICSGEGSERAWAWCSVVMPPAV
ncbi:hypothetical protein [Pseudomonas sp.]|uniref:hypothetical protein n=1 Tax=Pseudomonas sp. TaxID=306 RepID=UPI002907C078|nr:hypothetical protein [Pseudomonas sp.]MDU4255664.1 hypothetical protein [Pseudomonas sp.]